MKSLTYLLVALSSIAGSLAAPTDLAVIPREAEADAPDLEFSGSLAKRTALNYNQNYQTGGNVKYTSTSNGYSVTFSGASDFVVGRGWTTGAARAITYSGSWSASAGTVMLTIYGWTTNPLVEYYIMEDYTSYQGGGTVKGSVTSDGSSYTIYEHQQVNQPSIQGTSTFNQYISVRSSKRTSGTVTTSNHFNAWANVGLKLGTHNYQVVATEGWGGASGSTSMTVSG